jgi:hypothetical protein
MTAHEEAASGKRNGLIATGEKSANKDHIAEPAATESLIDAAMQYSRQSMPVFPCYEIEV